MTANGKSAVPQSLQKRFARYSISDKMKLLALSRLGVSPKIFYDFAAMANIPEKNLAGWINIHPRTITNYRTRNQKLDPVVSEHLLKIINLFAKGETVFGNGEEFKYWLRKPFWESGETPADWLTTPGSVEWLSDEIDRLAEGYPV